MHPRPCLCSLGNLWPSPQLQRGHFLCGELETLVSSSALSLFEYVVVYREGTPGRTEQVAGGWDPPQTSLPSPGPYFE